LISLNLKLAPVLYATPKWLIITSYHLSKCNEIYVDGMNSFQNESHFGIM